VAVAALAGTSTFRRVVTRAVGDRHRALISGETTFSFELPVGEGLVKRSTTLSARSPSPGPRAVTTTRNGMSEVKACAASTVAC